MKKIIPACLLCCTLLSCNPTGNTKYNREFIYQNIPDFLYHELVREEVDEILGYIEDGARDFLRPYSETGNYYVELIIPSYDRIETYYSRNYISEVKACIKLREVLEFVAEEFDYEQFKKDNSIGEFYPQYMEYASSYTIYEEVGAPSLFTSNGGLFDYFFYNNLLACYDYDAIGVDWTGFEFMEHLQILVKEARLFLH